MADQSHVGRRYEVPGQIVEAERAAEFAAAIAGDSDPYQPGSVPPTFASVYCLFPTMARLFSDEEVGVNLAGLIHGEQTFQWPTPVQPGDTVDASAEITAVEQKRGMTFLTIDVQATNQAGATVCAGRSLMIIRGDAG